MLAQLFKRTLDQYDRLRKRGAYLDTYRKEPMFANGLGEFDEARCVVLVYFESRALLIFRTGRSHSSSSMSIRRASDRIISSVHSLYLSARR